MHRLMNILSTNSAADAQQFDEGPIAARAAAFVGTDAHTLALTESDLVNALDNTVWHCEKPIFSFQGPGKFVLSKVCPRKGTPREPANYHAVSG
jgi:asparagine synthetase B (glutamine-hydrolysing)